MLQILAHEIRTGGIEAVADDLVGRDGFGQRADLGIVEVEHRLARGIEEMGEQLAELVHLLVVEADVGQHRDLGPVEDDRPVAFVDLADEQLGVADQGAGERRRGGDEILHHCAVHDRRLAVAAWRIQPIIPVTVDLPLVPPTATLRWAALSS